MSDAFSMTAGSMLSVRILAGLVLGWFVVTCLRQAGAERLLKVPIGVVSVAYLVSLAYGGHSRSESAPWLGIPVDVVHTAAIAVWLGGLIMLVIIVVPSVSASEAVAAFLRFSSVAQRAVVIIALTGAIQMMRIHGNPIEVFSSRHGLVLVAKVLLVAIMIRLALRNRATLQRHTAASLANSERSRDLLLRATTTEVLFGFGVLGLTAVLVAVTPG
jgi:copper transport protein